MKISYYTSFSIIWCLTPTGPFVSYVISEQEKFEDTKGVVRTRKV
jgi:hypothetical protein